ncbi:hypothetical protein FRB99_000431 [Tulasnella sp. 403]|nr:hypothetical protein FRB99_000431 [Tulasnella sp. 403]
MIPVLGLLIGALAFLRQLSSPTIPEIPPWFIPTPTVPLWFIPPSDSNAPLYFCLLISALAFCIPPFVVALNLQRYSTVSVSTAVAEEPVLDQASPVTPPIVRHTRPIYVSPSGTVDSYTDDHVESLVNGPPPSLRYRQVSATPPQSPHGRPARVYLSPRFRPLRRTSSTHRRAPLTDVFGPLVYNGPHPLDSDTTLVEISPSTPSATPDTTLLQKKEKMIRRLEARLEASASKLRDARVEIQNVAVAQADEIVALKRERSQVEDELADCHLDLRNSRRILDEQNITITELEEELAEVVPRAKVLAIKYEEAARELEASSQDLAEARAEVEHLRKVDIETQTAYMRDTSKLELKLENCKVQYDRRTQVLETALARSHEELRDLRAQLPPVSSCDNYDYCTSIVSPGLLTLEAIQESSELDL